MKSAQNICDCFRTCYAIVALNNNEEEASLVAGINSVAFVDEWVACLFIVTQIGA